MYSKTRFNFSFFKVLTKQVNYSNFDTLVIW